MKIYLPSNFNRGTMYNFISKVLDEDLRPRAHEMDFDFTELKFINPVGVTVISNVIGRLNKAEVRVTFTYFKPDKTNRDCPMSFLDDAMFFNYYLNHTLNPLSSLRPTTLPLANVTHDRSYMYLDNAMSWLATKLNLTKQSLCNIKSSIEEIFNNIPDHSSENNGYIFIQHYPNVHKVLVTVSDFGVGIPGSIQLVYPDKDDAEALRLAVQEGFTTKSTPRNRGAGLDHLLKNVAINNKGCVYIHSNHGILRCINDGNGGMVISTKKTKGFYPGTLFEIEFRTNTIEYLEEEDFSWDM